MKFTKIRQGGREYSIAFPNEEATLFGGVVPNATITSAGVTAVSTDAVVWNVATGQFLLRRGLTFYDAWAASADGTVDDAVAWNTLLVAGRRFYVDNGDGTMKWYYYNGEQMLETVSEIDPAITEALANHENSITKLNTTILDLGEFTSTSAGLAAAAEKAITENRDIRFITFRVPSLRQSVNILQQHFNYITTQIIFTEGKSRTSYQRTITTGDNYAVGGLQQLHLYTTIQVEGNELVGYTADSPSSPNTKRTVICSLDLDSVATLEDDAMRTIVEVAGVDYTTTTAPTSSTGTTGVPLYWLARPATFAVKSGMTYYTMPSTDERFAACGLRRVGQLFKCGGETFYLDENLNPVFVNSSVRFDRSGTSVKVYPSNSTLRSLYEAAGAVWNEDTGYYELNGVNDIDEEEIAKMYSNHSQIFIGNRQYGKHSNRINSERALFAIYSITGASAAFSDNSNIVSITYNGIDNVSSTANYAYNSCERLRRTTIKHYGSSTNYMTKIVYGCSELVRINIHAIRGDISFSDSPRISYNSLNYLATYAANTAAITVTLPTPQATIINTILASNASEAYELTVEEQNIIFQQIAQMPWEAKLKIEYTQPIWREDNGSTIAFTNRMPQLDEAGETYTFQDVTYNDVRPSLIKHEKGANGEYIYGLWFGYVSKLLATDRTIVGTELEQYTTALNTNFAVSLLDWWALAYKFGAKNITIADGGAAAASTEEE